MKNYSGAITALVTPFKNGEIDTLSFENLVKFQVENGINKFVINGTTAESPNLSWGEVETLFKTAKKIVGENGVLIVGTGSNSTHQTIETTKKAKDLGADAALVVCPYYNKPNQAGILQHYLAVADNVDLPIILYNVPGRTVVSISNEVILKLAEHKNIIGIKDATGDITLGKSLISNIPKDFFVTSGDDATCVELTINGGLGAISVVSHILPRETQNWFSRAQQGDTTVLNEVETYLELINGIYTEPNPIPVKKALELMGIIDSSEMRLPLVQMNEAKTNELKNRLKQHNLVAGDL